VIRRGSAQRFEIEATTAGFAAHLARFAGAAEILVGGRVFRSARAEWNFEALAAIDLPAGTDVGARVDEDTEPGIKRARVYRLRGPSGARRRTTRAPRRDDAVRPRARAQVRLRDAYRDALVARRKQQPRRSPAITASASAALVAAFLATVGAGEAYVLRTTTRVGTAMTPYGVLADLAREILGLADGAESHEVQRRLALALPLICTPARRTASEARAALAAVSAAARACAAPRPATAIPASGAAACSALVTKVEHHLEAERPLIIVGEDVHWCDQESMDLFAAMLAVPTSRPVLGLVTTRPDRRILEAAAATGGELLHLDELDPAARAALVASRFAPDDDVAELAEQILARSGGNPFFILEQLDALAERGIIAPAPEHPGRYRWVERDAPLQVPTSVEDLLITRIDRLPEREKQTVLCAAVLGRVVAPPAVAAILGRQVKPELDELVRRGLVVPHEGEYRFKNDTIMTVAYGLVPAEDRTRLHRVAAERIATGPGYRPGADDAHIARHLELAGDAVAAADRYLRAATHAIDVGGNADAFRQLSRALKLLPPGDHARRFQARRQREEILRRLARRPQQLRELAALRKEAEALGDPQKQALAHALSAQFYIDVGKAPAAQRAVAPALQFARDAGDKLAEADALRLRSAIARLVGSNDDSLKLCEQALALTAEAGDGSPALTTRALILNEQGTTLWNMGRLEAAIEAYAEALVIYRALRLPRQEARALNNMGIVFSCLGEYEEALAHYKSSLKLDQQLGDRSGVALKLGNIGQAYADLGERRPRRELPGQGVEARRADRRSVERGRRRDLVGPGQAGARRSSPARWRCSSAASDLASENRERFQEIRGLEYIALAQLDANQDADRRARAGALGHRAGAQDADDGRHDLRPRDHRPGPLAPARRARRRGRRHHRGGRAPCSSTARPEGAEHIWYWHGLALAGAGQLPAARAAFERAEHEIAPRPAGCATPRSSAAYLGSKTARAVAAALGRD
jgi:tetratricopeptide (TPR) repeat protein